MGMLARYVGGACNGFGESEGKQKRQLRLFSQEMVEIMSPRETYLLWILGLMVALGLIAMGLF